MKKGVGDDPFADEEPGKDAGGTDETTPETGQSAGTEPDAAEPFVDAIVQAFVEIGEGKQNKTVSFRGTSIKPLLLALEEDDEARQQLIENLDISEGADRSDIVRSLVKAGLRRESPETFEALAEARAKYAREIV